VSTLYQPRTRAHQTHTPPLLLRSAEYVQKYANSGASADSDGDNSDDDDSDVSRAPVALSSGSLP
jgi:hypothetical protein